MKHTCMFDDCYTANCTLMDEQSDWLECYNHDLVCGGMYTFGDPRIIVHECAYFWLRD